MIDFVAPLSSNRVGEDIEFCGFLSAAFAVCLSVRSFIRSGLVIHFIVALCISNTLSVIELLHLF